ncbi:hypothetical protein [Psittacicella gerlachiana]|uniref:Uncharacterized protein n=1 Tax=Psittacicella gerlachiana TaxID=2028574 RepID=A0A3A1Y8U3_9GAMM|nr:hypothetical protein [Psittacicella gerlachiana]RIY33971.1 hypothetical protein CKF59_05945 [Psittacicella gerlachiana]
MLGFLKKIVSSLKNDTTNKEENLPPIIAKKNKSFSEHQQLEAQISNPQENLPTLGTEHSSFEIFLKESSTFNYHISHNLLQNHRNLSLTQFFDLIVAYGKEYDLFSNHILHEEHNEQESRFLSLANAISLTFKENLFDDHGNINDKALVIIDFFLNDILYNHPELQLECIQAQDIEKILEDHFDNISTSSFFNSFIKPKYYPNLVNLLNKDIDGLLNKETTFFDKRLPFLILVDLLRKATFLPLSYHELLIEFFNNYIEKPQDSMHFQQLRRDIIVNEKPFMQLLITEYLTFKAYEFNLTSKSYFTDRQAIKSFRKKISLQPLYLFAYIILARRKTKSEHIFLQEKDILLLNHVAYLCESKVDFKKLYFYLKENGL